ncbi:hypothetical protein WA158_006398 [Blastocystis sp. Blastoise]
MPLLTSSLENSPMFDVSTPIDDSIKDSNATHDQEIVQENIDDGSQISISMNQQHEDNSSSSCKIGPHAVSQPNQSSKWSKLEIIIDPLSKKLIPGVFYLEDSSPISTTHLPLANDTTAIMLFNPNISTEAYVRSVLGAYHYDICNKYAQFEYHKQLLIFFAIITTCICTLCAIVSSTFVSLSFFFFISLFNSIFYTLTTIVILMNYYKLLTTIFYCSHISLISSFFLFFLFLYNLIHDSSSFFLFSISINILLASLFLVSFAAIIFQYITLFQVYQYHINSKQQYITISEIIKSSKHYENLFKELKSIHI